jgi:hypothetical protein
MYRCCSTKQSPADDGLAVQLLENLTQRTLPLSQQITLSKRDMVYNGRKGSDQQKTTYFARGAPAPAWASGMDRSGQKELSFQSSCPHRPQSPFDKSWASASVVGASVSCELARSFLQMQADAAPLCWWFADIWWSILSYWPQTHFYSSHIKWTTDTSVFSNQTLNSILQGVQITP